MANGRQSILFVRSLHSDTMCMWCVVYGIETVQESIEMEYKSEEANIQYFRRKQLPIIHNAQFHIHFALELGTVFPWLGSGAWVIYLIFI